MTKKISAAEQIRNWFAKNPTGELTMAQIAKRFRTTEGNARIACMRLRQEGVVETITITRLKRKS